MDFHQLQYFVAIAESGSITAAAKKLFLSQPPLSMQMKRLEKELGCVLFLRGAREVQLTEAGKLLYTRAKSMLELRRITEEELAVYKRGRNAKSYTMAKNATMKDYRKATGFEALMGYLYLQGETERLVSLVREGLGNNWTEEKKEEDRV